LVKQQNLNYTIYTKSNCPSCEEVVNFIEEKGVKCKEIKDAEDVGGIFIFPCLKSNDQPLAYGLKIIDYLNAND
jgi:glutaredoxin